jgi:hypothetical protein
MTTTSARKRSRFSSPEYIHSNLTGSSRFPPFGVDLQLLVYWRRNTLSTFGPGLRMDGPLCHVGSAMDACLCSAQALFMALCACGQPIR